MFKNLLLVALRNLKKDKWYSLLNILGLTIGISFSLLLIFYIIDELSYDRYNEKADRIYRINAHVKEPDKDTMRWAITPFPMGAALSNDYPEVERLFRKVTEAGYVETVNRLESLQFHNAEERYRALVRQQPELIHRVPLKYIASYLGITQVSLSRIRGTALR